MSYKDLIPGGSSSDLDLDPFRNPAHAAVRVLEDRLKSVYRERAFVVAALSRTVESYMTDIGARGVFAWLARHIGPEDWDADWEWVVYMRLDEGQVSWHIHKDELPLFDHLPRFDPPEVEYRWDGHDTTEKYRRIYEYVTGEKE